MSDYAGREIVDSVTTTGTAMTTSQSAGPTCRKCGTDIKSCRGWLERMNAKGIPGIWECRPSCAERLTQEQKILGAIEGSAP